MITIDDEHIWIAGYLYTWDGPYTARRIPRQNKIRCIETVHVSYYILFEKNVHHTSTLNYNWFKQAVYFDSFSYNHIFRYISSFFIWNVIIDLNECCRFPPYNQMSTFAQLQYLFSTFVLKTPPNYPTLNIWCILRKNKELICFDVWNKKDIAKCQYREKIRNDITSNNLSSFKLRGRIPTN